MMVGRNLLDIQEDKEGYGLAIRDDDGGVWVSYFSSWRLFYLPHGMTS